MVIHNHNVSSYGTSQHILTDTKEDWSYFDVLHIQYFRLKVSSPETFPCAHSINECWYVRNPYDCSTVWIMKVGISFEDTCTAFQCLQNSPEIFAGLPISSHIFGGINTNYCSTVWIMMIGTIVGVKHSTLSFLQIPLKFCPLCNNSQAIISGTPQFLIRHVNNTGGRWNCLWSLTSRLTGCQAWCALL